MVYENIVEAKFIARPNRFIAHVQVNGQLEVAHVKNTGRCKELLLENSQIFLQEFDSPKRKTKYDLIAVLKGDRLINMDSQIPNKVFEEFAKEGRFIPNITYIKAESTYKESRFDFYIEAGERKIFVEVKGVTLEENGVCRFPDAPTLRGIKHINQLIEATKEGYEAYVVFIVQLDNVSYFTPNDITHKDFGDTLRKAKAEGVNLLALTCSVSPTSIRAKDVLDIVL